MITVPNEPEQTIEEIIEENIRMGHSQAGLFSIGLGLFKLVNFLEKADKQMQEIHAAQRTPSLEEIQRAFAEQVIK